MPMPPFEHDSFYMIEYDVGLKFPAFDKVHNVPDAQAAVNVFRLSMDNRINAVYLVTEQDAWS